VDPGAWAHPLMIATFSARLPHRSGAQPSGLAAGERPLGDEHDERATGSEQPGLDLVEVAQARLERDRADPAAGDGDAHAADEASEPAPGRAVGKDRFCDRTADETENEERDETH